MTKFKKGQLVRVCMGSSTTKHMSKHIVEKYQGKIGVFLDYDYNNALSKHKVYVQGAGMAWFIEHELVAIDD